MTEFEEAAGDMDPAAAAEYATGAGDVGATGTDAGLGQGGLSTSGPLNRLFDGGAPGPSVGEIESDYGFAKDWSVFVRGCVRCATGDGVPPLVEIVIGAAGGFRRLARGGELPSIGNGGKELDVE